MYSFRKQQTFVSKRYPGIRAQIRPLTVELRARIDMAIAAHPERAAYYDCILAREEVVGDNKPERIKRASLNEQIFAMEKSQRTGPTLRECIVSIEGIEPEDATPDRLVEAGPADLCEEIIDFVNLDMRLSAVEEKNSLPPLDSSAPEPVATASTTAQSANGTATTVPAIVPSISPISPETPATNGVLVST